MTSNNTTNVKQLESQARLDSIQMNSSKTVAPKRLSIIDRGKSWARQFIKNSKLLQRSSDSCDSGIDLASSKVVNTTASAYSIKASMMSHVNKSASLSSKLPETYDQVYSSPCNSNSSALSTSSSSSSSSSSSGYLISPLDESGYLVPIVNLVNCSNDSFSNNNNNKSDKLTKSSDQNTPITTNNTTTTSNNVNTITTNDIAQLTRSQSTRSAYTTCSTNLTSSSSFYSHFNHMNRATICEKLNDDTRATQKNICIKCNCKLDKSKLLNNNFHIEQNEEDLAKSNRVYNLFESFTCSTCLNSDINNNNNNKKPTPAQQPQTVIPTNPPPPLPLLPPPSLKKSLQISSNNNESISNKQHFTVIKNNLNHHRHTIILVTNNLNPTCSQNINTDDNLNTILKKINHHHKQQQQQQKQNLIGDSNIKITPLVICAPNLAQSSHQYTIHNNSFYNHHQNINTAPTNNNSSSNLKSYRSNETKQRNSHKKHNLTNNEPIIYIDSIDELENYSISSSISSLSSISSPDKSSHSDNSYSIDMNQLLARLKSTTKNLSNLQHNNNNHTDLSNSNHLTPSNSVESFEFLTDSQANNSSSSTKPAGAVLASEEHNSACYEKSWDNTKASALLDKLCKDSTENVLTNSSLFLASSLIEIANQQQQQQNNNLEQHQKQADLLLRNRKSNAPAVRRISFPLQKLSSFREFEKLAAIPSHVNVTQAATTNSNSSITSSSIPVVRASRIIFNHSYNSQQQNINNSSDEVEHLITVPSIRPDKSESFKSKKITNNKSYSNSSSTSSTSSSSSASTASSTSNSNRYSYVISHKLEPCVHSFSSSIEDLNDVEWYQPNMPRENVQNYLANKEIGSFIIRLSNTCKDCYALSIRVPYFANQNGIAHYLIIRNSRGYKLKGVEKDFKSLKSLVTHYSVMQEILPVTLNMSTILNNNKNKSNEINQIGVCKN